MAKYKIFHLNSIWSMLNIALAFYIWRKAVEFDGGNILIGFNLPTYILGFVILNSLLVFATTREKQYLFGYLINSLTLYLLIIIIIEIFFIFD